MGLKRPHHVPVTRLGNVLRLPLRDGQLLPGFAHVLADVRDSPSHLRLQLRQSQPVVQSPARSGERRLRDLRREERLLHEGHDLLEEQHSPLEGWEPRRRFLQQEGVTPGEAALGRRGADVVLHDGDHAEEVLGEGVHGHELHIGTQEGLVRAAVGAGQQQPVGPEHQRVAVGDAVRGPRVANHLLELVFIFALVQIFLSLEVRDDFVGHDEADLGPVGGVPAVDEVEGAALGGREEGLHDLARVRLDVNEEPREVVEGDGVLHAVHHRLQLQAVEAGAVGVDAHAKGLDLHDAVGLRELDVGLQVHVAR
mmetsp:Transcript_18270/g.69164  ORF Transcript_18270/g.69164 Transcript_18270/m.69164 type:complete len:310 (+) Transcript_18270:432-1361(+)